MQTSEVVKSGKAEWALDPAHSSVALAVRHMGLFAVRGSFERVSGKIETTDGSLSSIEANIEAESINTGNADRDAHLRSGEFLNAEEYPLINFRSTRIIPVGRGQYDVTGDLTIRGQAHPVSFRVETMEPVKDPWGMVRAGGAASGELSRKQWGLTWNQVLETGSLLVGDEVKYTLEVEATLAQPAE